MIAFWASQAKLQIQSLQRSILYRIIAYAHIMFVDLLIANIGKTHYSQY